MSGLFSFRGNMKHGSKRKNSGRVKNPVVQKPFFSFSNHEGTSAEYGAGNTHIPFFQPALTMGQPNDKYEREADTVADKVTGGNSAVPVVQQQPISQVQKADLQEQTALQRQPEKEEEEPVQKAAEKEEEASVQMAVEKEEEEPVQKQTEKEEEEPVQAQKEEEEEAVQAKSVAGFDRSGAGFVSAQLGRQKGSGEALPTQPRQYMEASFGTSFDGVKIHTDSAAVQMNKAIGAKAFTHGKDIYFNSGYFAPHTHNGRHLLAHELTHVVQQTGRTNSGIEAGAGATIHRELERDATGAFTGNYLFRTGPALSESFMRRFKQYVADGSLTDDELNRLRLFGIQQRGTVTQAERLLMAAGLEPANHPLIAAHTTGPLSIPNAQITSANRDHVSGIGRGTLSPEYEAMFFRALMAFLSGNFDEAAAEMANINETAIQEILTIGDRSWQHQAENLVAFIEVHNLPAVSVLSAMYNAASDSSSGDQIMAGMVYATAAQAGHSMAANIASGSIKVDALIPSALQKLTNNSGVDAFYSAASLNDRIKSDTLYVPTTLNILELPSRALIIHELTHGAQDAAAPNLTMGPQIDMEMGGYREQAKYIMDQLLATPPDTLDMEVFSVRHLANIALFQWSFIVETLSNRSRYEAIAKRILLQSPSVTEGDINNALALTQLVALQRLRNAILSMPQYGGNPNAARDGLKGESILDNVN
jgi:hypothetical protein